MQSKTKQKETHNKTNKKERKKNKTIKQKTKQIKNKTIKGSFLNTGKGKAKKRRLV